MVSSCLSLICCVSMCPAPWVISEPGRRGGGAVKGGQGSKRLEHLLAHQRGRGKLERVGKGLGAGPGLPWVSGCIWDQSQGRKAQAGDTNPEVTMVGWSPGQ